MHFQGALIISHTKYRSDIQVLRGLAVLAVVLFHAKESYFPRGYLGVDVFFVISGFVVTPLILRIFTDQANGQGPLLNLRDFYKKRFYRLAPALAVTLAISAASIFLLGQISDHQRFASQGIATLLLAGNFGAYRFSGDYFSPNPNPLVHTWSLSVEEQIYIFLPLTLMFILHNRTSIKRITALVFTCILTISFISFLFPTILQLLYSRAGILSATQFSFYSPIDRVWQFTLGGLAFLILDRHQIRKWKISRSKSLIVVIAVIAMLFGPTHMSFKFTSILASLFAVIVIASKSLTVLPNFLIQKLGWLGDRSYSIYLFHLPLLYIAKYSPVVKIGNEQNRIIQSIIAVFCSILFGSISYSKIENRYRNRSESNTTGSKTILTAIVLTFAIPLTLFASMDIGLKKQYWGLDKNITKPTSAWELDPKCNRMSELDEPCFYKIAGSKQTILLIGDSHAAHISQAVVDAAKRENWDAAIWTQAGCNVQFRRSVKDQVTDQCLRQNQEILKWVKGEKPTAIIVSQLVYADSNQNDLRKAISTLNSIVPNVLLVENNPNFPDEKDFMAGRPLVMRAYKPPKSFKLSEMRLKDKNASNQLANWARKNNISTMNFESLFCNKKVCTRYAGSDWLYLDDDHFSVAGAELTIPQLAAFLKNTSS